MKPITYYIQTPAVDALVKEYGDRLEVMSPGDLRCFLRLLIETLEDPEMDEPDGTDKALQAWWFVANTSDAILTALIAAVATIQMENLAGDEIGDISPTELPL